MGMSIPKPSCGHRFLRVALFFYMFFYWLIGVVILSVGIYAEIAKWNYQSMVDVFVTPSSIMVVVGVFMFILGSLGCIGALRENIILLKIFGWTHAIIFILLLVCGIIALIFRGQVKDLVSQSFKNTIEDYYNDPDIQFTIDSIQLNFDCCGGFGFEDWENNIYFMCSSPGVTACGVPYSCCKSAETDIVVNTQCGNGVREGVQHRYEVSDIIHVSGCTDAVLTWAEDNLGLMGGIALAFAFTQIFGIGLIFLFVDRIRDKMVMYTVA
ncbi:tetraspanin-15-like isoform X2 [Patiria miniata]|uniref:Tetraspanin n=1 Tax=Patiria miniata TaxID=46514 RepID=A0A914AAQ6_PATMI|nr:tetraspanin-15-like isoform X2 [Patiria miniata]